jgi:hypothetical protein
MDNYSAYQISLSGPGTIIHEGSPVDPIANPVPLSDGWNWIAYLPQDSLEINSALQSLRPSEGDLIKSQFGFANWLRDEGIWVGDFEHMFPGQGYRLYLKKARLSDNRLVYPETSGGPALAADQVSEGLPGGQSLSPSGPTAPQGPGWSVNPSAFQYNMTTTARLELPAGVPLNDHVTVAAFAGDEVRGIGYPQFVPGIDEYRVFLMVYANDPSGEEITLRAYDADRSQMYASEETFSFEADEAMGSLREPLVSEAAPTSYDPSAPRETFLGQNAPNPFNPVTTIRYGLTSPEHVTIKLYDVRGREVRTFVDDDQPAGWHEIVVDAGNMASGIYFYRMTAGRFERVKKMTLLK